MSNIFLKNKLFDSLTESSINLPNNIQLIDINTNKQQTGGNNIKNQNENNYSDTSSVLMSKFNNKNSNFSITSSILKNNQNGGNINKNSDNNNDINKLLSMLTSESNNNLSESTSTDSLENKLVNMLSSKNINNTNPPKQQHPPPSKTPPPEQQQGGNNNYDPIELKKYFHTLESNGIKVDLKLNNKSLSEFFNLAQHTTTEINNKQMNKNEIINNLMDSQSSDNILNNENNINTTTSSSFFMNGGAKLKKEKVKGNRVPSEAFLAFGKLKNHVAKKLNIPASKIAMQIASQVLKDIKAKNEGIDTIKAVEKSIDLFNSKSEYYHNMFKK
jgi:hypothetical protein